MKSILQRAPGLLLAAVVVALCVGASAMAMSPITEFPILSEYSGPTGIAAGPDGNIWFTEYENSNVAKITPTGAITEYAIPTTNAQPYSIAAGADGDMWFTQGIGKIGKVNMMGQVTQYDLASGSNPTGITKGPDGLIWFTEFAANKVGKITPAGIITDYPVPTAHSGPSLITPGPDGNLWFTEQAGNKVAKITLSGSITEYAVPTASAFPYGITPAADGNMWFSEPQSNKIGKLTTSGVITEYPMPESVGPLGMTSGPDGRIWTGSENGEVDSIGLDGKDVRRYRLAQVSEVTHIAKGADGNMWFGEFDNNKIGRISPNIGPSTNAKTQVTGQVTKNGLPVSGVDIVASCNNSTLIDTTGSDGVYLVTFDSATKPCPAHSNVRVNAATLGYNGVAYGNVQELTTKLGLAVINVKLSAVKQ